MTILRSLVVAIIALLSPTVFAQTGEADEISGATSEGHELLIHLTQSGTIQAEGLESDSAIVYDSVRSFIERDSSSLIVFSTSPQAKYMRYVEVLDIIRIAVRDGIALAMYRRLFREISEAEQAVVLEKLPPSVRLERP